MNKVTLIGRTGAVIKVQSFANGGKVGSLNIATDESYKNKETNEKVEKTEWHRLVIPERLCDVFTNHIPKGVKIAVEGKLSTRSYGNEGDIRYVTEVKVFSFEFCESKKNLPVSNSASQDARPPREQNFNTDNEPDDLPF